MKAIALLTRAGLLPSLILLLLSGCATQYYQLRPVSGEVAQIDGRAVTKASADSLEVVASFEREDMEYMALDVEFKNRTDHTLDIDPSNFRMVALDASKQPIVTPGRVDFKQAADPDYEAGRMGYKMQREETRLKRAKIMNTVLAVAVVAASVAAVSSSPRSRNGRDVANYIATQNTLALTYNALQVKRVIDYGTFADRMQRLDFEAYRWKSLALKRSVVQPGQSVRGFVYLPKAAREAAFLNLTYPMPSGSAVEIMFQQNMTMQRPH